MDFGTKQPPKDKTFVKAYDTYDGAVLRDLAFPVQAQLLLATADREHVDQHCGSLPVYNYQVQCSLLQFVSGVFLDECIKQGDASVLSSGKLAHESVFGIANGKLYLALDKDLYRRAGVVGERSKHHHSKHDRRFVTYDMRAAAFTSGNSAYDRLAWSLHNTPLGAVRSFTVCMPDGGRMPPHVQALFGQQCTEHSISPAVNMLPQVPVPSLDVPPGFGDVDTSWRDAVALQEWCACTYEWAALVTGGCVDSTLYSKPDDYLCSYEMLDVAERRDLALVTWRGLLTNRAMAQLSRRASERRILFNAYGDENAPVAWREQEHGFVTSGESICTVLDANHGVTMVYKHMCGGDLA